MSGSAAPDPRILPIERAIFFRNDHAPTILAWIDAADRAAGVIRVRVDDATVEKVARTIHDQRYRLEHGYVQDWDTQEESPKSYYRAVARAVLEALVTP